MGAPLVFGLRVEALAADRLALAHGMDKPAYAPRDAVVADAVHQFCAALRAMACAMTSCKSMRVSGLLAISP